MNKKISTIAGSLIILAIVIALGFSFLASNKKEMQNQNNTSNVTENKANKNESNEKQFKELSEQKIAEITELTKNWKTFRDEEYGYEFKYPQDYHIEKNKYNKDIDEISIISNEKCIQDFNEKCNITIRTLSPEDERVENLKESYDQNTTRFSINENKITYRISDGLNALIQANQKIYFMTSLSHPQEIVFIFQGIYSTFNEIKKETTLTKIREDGSHTYYDGKIIVSGKYQEMHPDRLFGGELCFFVDNDAEYLIPLRNINGPNRLNRVAWFCFSNQSEAKKMFNIDETTFQNQKDSSLAIVGNAKIEISHYITDSAEIETSDVAQLEKIISKEDYSLEKKE